MQTLALVVTGIVLVAAPGWAADESAALHAHATAVNRMAQTPEGRQAVVQRLSQDLGLSTATLQSQRQQTGLGWGELLIANRISQRTGMSFDRVVADFRSGRGWGEIARAHDLNLGKLVSDVKASQTAVRASDSARGRARSGEGAGITTGGNRTQAGADAGVTAGAEGRAGHGWGRGGNRAVTFGTGASGHAGGGPGLGLGHGGGRR